MLRMSVPGERSESDKAKPVVKDAGAPCSAAWASA